MDDVPRGGNDASDTSRFAKENISVHVPREGNDRARKRSAGRLRISIHVPREGNDISSVNSLVDELKFQSTFPARGTTRLKCTE